MAGSDPRFDPNVFRTNIRFAMRMGMPEDATKGVTFRFGKTKTWPSGAALDQDGNPFDPTLSAIVTEPDPVQIPVGVEFSQASPEELPVGQFVGSKVVLTMLDEDYEEVKLAKEVTIDGDDYIIRYEEPPIGLFDVTVHRFVCTSKDES